MKTTKKNYNLTIFLIIYSIIVTLYAYDISKKYTENLKQEILEIHHGIR